MNIALDILNVRCLWTARGKSRREADPGGGTMVILVAMTVALLCTGYCSVSFHSVRPKILALLHSLQGPHHCCISYDSFAHLFSICVIL